MSVWQPMSELRAPVGCGCSDSGRLYDECNSRFDSNYTIPVSLHGGIPMHNVGLACVPALDTVTDLAVIGVTFGELTIRPDQTQSVQTAHLHLPSLPLVKLALVRLS